MNESVPPLLQQILSRELEPGEQVIWQARPSPLSLVLASATTFLFGIPFFAFAVFWTWAAAFHSGAGWFGLLWGGMFVVIGACLLLSPFWAWWVALRTLYVITSLRALLIEAPFRRSIRSFTGERLAAVERREDSHGRGSIIFERQAFTGKGGRIHYHEVGFFGLADAERIAQLIQAISTKSPHT